MDSVKCDQLAPSEARKIPIVMAKIMASLSPVIREFNFPPKATLKQLRIEKTKLELRAKRDKLMQKLYKRPDPITEFGSIATTSVKKSDSLEPSIRGGSPEPSFVTLTQF